MVQSLAVLNSASTLSTLTPSSDPSIKLPSASRQKWSNAELCRYVADGDTALFTPDTLMMALQDQDMMERLRLNVRYYVKRDQDNHNETQHTNSSSFARIKAVSMLLDLSYNQSFALVNRYLQADVADHELILSKVLEFFLDERRQILYLLSMLLHSAGDQSAPYCDVAREIIPRITDFFDNVLQSYEELSIADVPTHLSREHAIAWSDNCVQEQVLLLQVIVCHFFAVSSSPTKEHARRLLTICQRSHFGGRPVIYTMLSASGRDTVKCIGALWNTILAHIMQLPLMVNTLRNKDKYPDLVIGSIQEHSQLDEQWFSCLGDMEEHGPALLAWSVTLCLSYQIQEQSNQSTMVQELKQCCVARLKTALKIDAFSTMLTMLKALDHHSLLHSSANVLARDNCTEILHGLCLSDVYNVIASITDIHVTSLLPLYSLLLDGHPVLCDEMWSRVTACVIEGDVLQAFPTFAYTYQRFFDALPLTSAAQNDSLNDIAVFLSLLTAMSSSALCAQKAVSILAMAMSRNDGLYELQRLYEFCIHQLAVTLTMPSSGNWQFIVSMTKFLNKYVPLCAITVSSEGVEAVLRLLVFVTDNASSIVFEERDCLVHSCFVQLCASTLDAAFVDMLNKYSFTNLMPRIIRCIDSVSACYQGLHGLLTLIQRIISVAQHTCVSSDDSYESMLNVLLDFIVCEVMPVYDSWKYAKKLGRWEMTHALFELLHSLLLNANSSDSSSIRTRLGVRVARQMLCGRALQSALLLPILMDRQYLDFGHPKSVTDTVSQVIHFAFHLLQQLLDIRCEWAKDVTDETLFHTFFSNGVETSRMLAVVLTYMDLSQARWSKYAICFFSRLCNLSALLPQRFDSSCFSLAGFLGLHNVEMLRKNCTRSLALCGRGSRALQQMTLELLCSSLRYQAGLAERLFGYIPKSTELAEYSVWEQLQRVLRDTDNPLILEELLKCFVALWEAAADYRNIAAILPIIVACDKFWPMLCKVLTLPAQSNELSVERTVMKASACTFRVLSCEMRYTDGRSASLQNSQMMLTLLSGEYPQRWLDCLDTRHNTFNCLWSELDKDSVIALSLFIGNWHIFMQSVLLYAHTIFVSNDLVSTHTQFLSSLLHCDELPLIFASQIVSVLIAVVYRAVEMKVKMNVDDLLDLITQALLLHDASLRRSVDEKEMRCGVIEKLLTITVLLLMTRSSGERCVAAASAFGVATRLYGENTSQSRRLLSVLPFLLDRVPSPRDYIEPLSEQHRLRTMMSCISKFEQRSRSKALLQFVLRIAVKPRCAAMLVSQGLLSIINNSWMRSFDFTVFDTSGRRSEAHEVWCLVLDIVIAMMHSFGHERIDQIDSAYTDLLRQVSEFLVVFQRQISTGLRVTSATGRMELTLGSLGEMNALCNLLYEVTVIPSRWRLVPRHLLVEHKQLVRFVAVTFSKLLADAPRLQESSGKASTSSRLLMPVGDEKIQTSSAAQKRIELAICRMLCSALSFLRVFTPAVDESSPQRVLSQSDLLFTSEITYRTCGEDAYRDEAMPITFIVELVDYCLASLSPDVTQTAGLDDDGRVFVESHAKQFCSAHQFLVEHGLFILISFAQIHLSDVDNISLKLVQDYVDILSRLRRSAQSLLSASLSDCSKTFFEDVLLLPMQNLEHRLVCLLRASR